MSLNRTLNHVLAGVVTLALPTMALAGAPCSVPGDYPTIQDAVNAPTCDQILLSPQTYTEEVVVARSVTISGNGATIDGNNTFRPLTIDGRATGTTTVSITNLSLTDGLGSSGSINARNGGCLLIVGDADGQADVTASGLTVSNCIASDSALSGFGGGIAVRDNATLDLSDSTISNNYASRRASTFTASGSGGGLYVRGTTSSGAGQLTVTRCTIQNNVAAHLTGVNDFAAGGGLRVQEEASATLVDNTWRDNVARRDGSDSSASALDLVAEGGAIAVTATTQTALVEVTGDQFIDNTADLSNADLGSNELPRGGAVSLHATNTSGQIYGFFTDVTMTGNQAKAGTGTGEGRGGAIHARGATLSVDQSTIVGNRADNGAITTDDGYGGGIYFREPDVTPFVDFLKVTSSIVSGNDSCNGIEPDCIGDGAQIFIDFSGTAQHVATLVHVTLADDTANLQPALHFFGPTAGDELIVHNSIITNHTIGIQNVTATGWSRGLYNLFQGNGTNRVGTAFGDEATWVTGDADFVNPGAGDYHIGAASDAIGLGRAVDVGSYTYDVTHDVDGEPVTPGGMNEVDSGADQLGSPSIFSDGFESGNTTAWSATAN
jgi:hypothetical protein